MNFVNKYGWLLAGIADSNRNKVIKEKARGNSMGFLQKKLILLIRENIRIYFTVVSICPN